MPQNHSSYSGHSHIIPGITLPWVARMHLNRPHSPENTGTHAIFGTPPYEIPDFDKEFRGQDSGDCSPARGISAPNNALSASNMPREEIPDSDEEPEETLDSNSHVDGRREPLNLLGRY